MVVLPRHVVNQPRLQEQVSPGQQVVTDEILVGSHRDPVAEAEGAQHIQNLQRDTPETPLPPKGLAARPREGARGQVGGPVQSQGSLLSTARHE